MRQCLDYLDEIKVDQIFASYDFIEERELLAAIIKQAVIDIVACPNANPDPTFKYKKDSAAADSASAKQFLRKDNPDFAYYCELLGFDPEFVEEICYDFIRRETLRPKGKRRLRLD